MGLFRCEDNMLTLLSVVLPMLIFILQRVCTKNHHPSPSGIVLLKL